LYLALLFFLSYACYSQQVVSFGGTIVVHRNGNGLYIGVDSKSVGDTANNPICKIHIVGKTVIATIGILGLKDLDLAEIADKTINDNMSYLQMMTAFSRETNRALSRLLGNFDMANQRIVPLLTVVFVKTTTIPDTLFASCVFTATKGDSTKLILKSGVEIVSYPDSRDATKGFGVIGAINLNTLHDALIANRESPNRVANTIEGAILAQIITTPDLVGEPIYVLGIEPSGALHWIGEEPKCKKKTQ
jgi:hypothetical protein